MHLEESIDMKPVSIEVVGRALTAYDHCIRCLSIFRELDMGRKAKMADIDDYPTDMKEDSVKLSKLLHELYELYKHRISFRLIDAQSPLGIYKSLIHRFRIYPTFIIEKKDVCSGWDRKKLEELIDRRIKNNNAFA